MAPIKKYGATKKYGARIQFTDETLFPGDDWYYLAAGHEWYNPVSQSTISEEDMPWELKPGPTPTATTEKETDMNACRRCGAYHADLKAMFAHMGLSVGLPGEVTP